MLRAFRRPRMVENSTSSPSVRTQMTLDCGAPFGPAVLRIAKTGWLNSRRASSLSLIVTAARLFVFGRRHQCHGDRDEAFAAAGETEPVRRGAGDGHRRADGR